MQTIQDWQKIYDHIAPKHSAYWLETPSIKQQLFLMTKQREVLFGGAAGGGKEVWLEELIPTPTGFKKAGEIEVGDPLLGRDGKTYHVLARSDIHQHEGWRFTFDDGSTVVTNDEHLWLTYDAKELEALTRRSDEFRANRRETRPSRATGSQGEYKSLAVAERNRVESTKNRKPAPTGTVRTTQEIVDTLMVRGGRANHAIPVAAPIQLPERELPIDPYTLGAWLGDGTSAAGSICGEDPEIWAEVPYAVKSKRHTLESNPNFAVVLFEGLTGLLRETGLQSNKHIPHDYLWASEEQRLALLQGLMDTDGNVSESSVEFVNTNRDLVEGVAHLARSLGMKVAVREGRAKLNGKDCGPKWMVKFAANRIVFRLPRKAEAQKIATRRTNKFRYIKNAERVSPRPMRCFKVSSPDELFLVTEHFIPTHNSSALIMSALQYVDVPGYSAIMFRRTFSDLALPGALMDRFKDWMSEYPEVTWNNNSYTATFPSGARVTFGYLNNINDKLRYKGSEFQFCVRGDTDITMADGSSKPISEIEPGVDYVQTLEGPRKVTNKYHVGMKPSVYLFTPNGCIVTSDNHALLTANGRWQDPTSLAANLHQPALSSAAASEKTRPGSQGPGPDSHWGLTPIPEPARLEQALARLQEIYASEANGRNDYESFVNELLEDPLLPVATFHAALHGPDPQTGAYAFSGSSQQGEDSHGLIHPSQLSSLDDYWLYHDHNGGLLHSLPVAAQAHTPSPAGAASQYLPSSHLGGLEHIQPHNQKRSGKLYHPYTNQEMALTDGVHRAYAGMIPAGEQDLWDIRVEGSSHYISTTSSTLHKNCGFDEVTEIRQDDYLYLFSRLRQPATGPLSQIPLRMRATTNPAPNWVRQRFIVEGKQKGRLFIPSSLEDNPGINIESYRETLSELDPIERKRLEFGDWWASSLGSMFPRENFPILEENELPNFDKDTRWVRFWDLAATKPSHSNPDPDWTVGTLMAFHQGVAYVMDVCRFREEGDEVERRIRQAAIEDGPEVPIRMEQEPGSAGKNLLDQYARYVLPGLDFTGVRATGAKDVRAKPMSSAAANGNVRLKMAAWNTDWIDEHAAFPEATTVHDDQVDSAVHAFNYTAGLDGGFRRKVEIIM